MKQGIAIAFALLVVFLYFRPVSRVPSLKVSARPDIQNPGNLGIGLTLKIGRSVAYIGKDGSPLMGRIEVRTPDGKLVHEDTQQLDKFTFG